MRGRPAGQTVRRTVFGGRAFSPPPYGRLRRPALRAVSLRLAGGCGGQGPVFCGLCWRAAGRKPRLKSRKPTITHENHMLDIQHLTRRYQNKLAVSDLSLTFEKGKTYALLGPNGSGKTTLMKMIAGLTKQTSGEITLDGIPVGPETKKHIAYMPTESYFYSYMSIADAGK